MDMGCKARGGREILRRAAEREAGKAAKESEEEEMPEMVDSDSELEDYERP